MQILVNDNNLITSYATIGGFDGAIEVDDTLVPDTFISEFKPKKFLYEDGKISYNPEYENIPNDSDNNKNLQTEVDSLKQQVADLTALIQQLLNKE